MNSDAALAARDHCDKHVVKMVVEYAQLLSTAHRVLDGVQTALTWEQPTWKRSDADAYTEIIGNRKKRRVVRLLDGETAEMRVIETTSKSVFKLHIDNRKVYNETHANHPSAVWARQTSANYEWLHELWVTLMGEFTCRYGKRHATMDYLHELSMLPSNIPRGTLTEFPQAMLPQYQVPNDPIAAYRRFYVGSKSRFAKWTNCEVPQWFVNGITASEGEYDASRFERTRRMV